jgi:hypothetical protein
MSGARNQQFLSQIGVVAKQEILDSVAQHYGVDRDAALEEVSDDDAHELLEYMVEPSRSATLVLMKRCGHWPPPQ